ncbi:MAG: hypothetical protein J6U20_08910 [Fibrobacter sp.]|nr:hypothetical protein [Fibrobacter sp.]
MNIRKHLKRLFLISTAIFWTSCSDDSQSSNPVAEPEANNSSVAAQCHEAEKVVKRKFNTDIMNDPVAYATKSAEKGAQLTIRDSIEEKISDNAPACLKRMLDTLETPVYLYGAPSPDYIATKFECDDGTSYINEDYLRYQEELEEYEKKYAIFNETYDQIEEKRVAELKNLMDSCINHPEDFPPSNDEYVYYDETEKDSDDEEDSDEENEKEE